MKTGKIGWWAVLLVAVTAFGCGNSGGEAEDERAAVEAAAADFYAALNTMFTGELDPMKEVWSHAADVTYMGPAGGMQVGWGAVLAEWEAQAAMKLGGFVAAENPHVLVAGFLAVVQNRETGQNGQGRPVSIRATNLFRKENGAWKMIGHHTDLLPFLSE